MRQRMPHHFGLFVDFLGHEVIVAGLVHQRGTGGGGLDFAVGGAVLGVEDRRLAVLDHRDIAVFQIGNLVGERCQCESVGAKIGFFFRIAHGQRRALARADQQALMILEDHGDGIGPGQARHSGLGGCFRRHALVHIVGDQMGGHFAVGLGFKFVAPRRQLVAQFAEIFDDAVMDDGDPRRGMGMGVGFRRRAMRRPARMADAGMAGERIFA